MAGEDTCLAVERIRRQAEPSAAVRWRVLGEAEADDTADKTRKNR